MSRTNQSPTGQAEPAVLSRAAAVWLVVLVGFVAVLLGLAIWLLPTTRWIVRTAFLMPAFFVQDPIVPSSWGAPPPVHTDLPLGSDFPGAILHIYRPVSGRHPALVISLGVDPAPPDDPRVVRLLSGFARSGIVAVLVESPDLNAERLEANAPALLVRAVQVTAAQPYVDSGKVGLFGLSVGGSLALIAASNPSISGRIRLVEAFGAYDSLTSLMRDAATESLVFDGKREAWQPDALTLQALRLNLVDHVSSPRDRTLLQTALLGNAPPPAAPPAGLSPEGRTVFTLATATNAATFDSAYATLPESERDLFRALSPASHLAAIRAPVYLMVDQGDPLVPFVESVQINATLRSDGHYVYFSKFDIFRHVDPTRGGNPVIVARDVLRLFLHVTSVLTRLFGGQ